MSLLKQSMGAVVYGRVLPLCNGSSLRFLGDDEPTAETSILHHLVSQELQDNRRRQVKNRKELLNYILIFFLHIY